MRYSELKKELRKAGCSLHHEGGNHEIWFSPITGKFFPVSRHNTEEVRTGTLKSIRQAAGLK
ncbi:MAG: type II toxin-antitoxin system HicA family toxin [Oscillospiraceae bacterium]|nr:type II toxin-antitoxin system HicA family toxin [Oscillospiraceae bacterium]